MNIVVCLKQVPGTTQVKINPETNSLVREGIESIINPFDTYALEEGVRLKEEHGGKVTVVTMGPAQAESALREAVSLGADEVILLNDRAFAVADTWATASALAAAMRKLGAYDIIICGRQTIDGDTGQVGPELAEMLEIPFIAYVSNIEEIKDSYLRVRRMVEEGHEIIETALPAVITVAKEINVPRLPSLRGKMKAKSAAVTTWTIDDVDVPVDKVGLAGSSTQVIKVFFPQRVSQAEILEGGLESKVDTLIERLRGAQLC